MQRLLQMGSLALLGMLAATRPAFAVPQFTAYDLLDSFNAITSGNFTTTSETEGAVLVGGNLSPGPGGVDNKSGSAAITSDLSPYFSRVSVYGNAGGAWTVTAGDAVQIGGTNSASFANAASVTAGYNFQISASAVQASLSALSTTLAGQGGTAITPDVSNNLTFTGPGTGVTDTFTITLAQLQTASAIAFNTGTDSVIINVTGAGTYNQAANFTGGRNPNDIIWNFEAATALNFSGFDGTVLALGAAVTNTSAINGTVAALSFNGGGELHSHPFTGNEPTPVTPPTPPTINIPEPTGLGVFLVALVGLTAIRHSRRARS